MIAQQVAVNRPDLLRRLVLVLFAMAGGEHERVVVRFWSWWTRVRAAIGQVVTGTVFLVGTLFLPDTGCRFAAGEFLVPG